jgi:hypothetical protein
MTNALSVGEQKTVTFYDDELTTIRANDWQIYVVHLTCRCGIYIMSLAFSDHNAKQTELSETRYSVTDCKGYPSWIHVELIYGQ